MKKVLGVIFVVLLMVAGSTSAALVDVYAKANSTSGGNGASTGVLLSMGDYFYCKC